jgi:hypothetical protein
LFIDWGYALLAITRFPPSTGVQALAVVLEPPAALEPPLVPVSCTPAAAAGTAGTTAAVVIPPKRAMTAPHHVRGRQRYRQ